MSTPSKQSWLHRHRFLELTCTIGLLMTLGWGLSLIALPDRHTGQSLRIARELAALPVWGIAFVTVSIVAALALISHNRAAHWPVWFVSLAWCIWGLANVVSVPARHAAPGAAVISLGMAALYGAAAVVYAKDTRRQDDP